MCGGLQHFFSEIAYFFIKPFQQEKNKKKNLFFTGKSVKKGYITVPGLTIQQYQKWETGEKICHHCKKMIRKMRFILSCRILKE